MQAYSPFDKRIDALEPSDLAALRNVHEGWYVEYKSELVTSNALAKAISAFANTYGGWLFLGVKEKSKDNPTAGAFSGIPEAELDTALQRLRQSASEHLNPTPHFQTKVLRGPCNEIGLISNLSIIVVEVPQSHIAPHVHKDGRIYRRVADGSEPKPETDRFILDQLWKRADPIHDAINEWVDCDPEFSKGEDKMPYIRLLLCVDPWYQNNSWMSASLPKIRNIITSKIGSPSNVPFDTFYTTSGGYIARQVGINDPHNYVLTWKIWRDLSCEVVLPMPLYSSNSIDFLFASLDGYNYGDTFIDIIKEKGYTEPRVVDLNFIMNILSGIVSKYRRLLDLSELENKFYFKLKILNTWRVLPFLDVETILTEYRNHGLPITIDRTIIFPIGRGPDSFKFIDEMEVELDEHKEDVASNFQANLILIWLARALGVPVFVEGETESDATAVPTNELIDAGRRAMIAQERRNVLGPKG